METAPVRPGSESNRQHYELLACLGWALVLRVAVICIHANELTHDRDAYLALASGIVAGQGYVTPETLAATAYRPPLYPLTLAALMLFLPTAAAVAVVNLFWGAVTVWATWRAARCLGLRWGSTVAALLVAVDPMLLLYSAQPMTEVTCAGLLALLVFWSVRRDYVEGIRQFVVGGLFGVLVLCRPTFWPLAGFALIAWLWSCLSRQHREQNREALPWREILGTVLVVAPWVIRNQFVMGSPILTTTHGGYTVLLANNPVFYTEVVDRGWGGEWTKASFDQWQQQLQTDLERELDDHASEVDRDRWQSRQARQIILTEPARFLKAVAYRVRSLWSTTPQGDSAEAAGSWLIHLVGWYYAIELLAFASGMVVVGFRLARSSCPPVSWWLLLAIVLTVQLVHLVYWTNARMRAPIVPIICLFAVVPVVARREGVVEARAQ